MHGFLTSLDRARVANYIEDEISEHNHYRNVNLHLGMFRSTIG